MGKMTSKLTLRLSTSGSPKKRQSICDSSQNTPTNRKTPARRPAENGNSEPPAKRNRSDAHERPNGKNTENGRNSENRRQAPEEEKTRRRRTLKAGDDGAPRCTFCKEVQTSELESLTECAGCKAPYHIRRCLKYYKDEELAKHILELDDWFCPRCITCSTCAEFISDSQNLECSSCCRAWHGACAPKGIYPSGQIEAAWFCGNCAKVNKLKDGLSSDKPTRRSKSLVPVGRKSRSSKDVLEFNGDIDELTDLINKRDFTWDYLNHKAGFSSDPPIRPSPSKKNKHRNDDDYDYSKAGKSETIPPVVAKDVKLFKEAAVEAYPEIPGASHPPPGQFLHFGTGKSCKAIYTSAYEEPLHSSPDLYACKFCLHTTHLKEDLIVHWDHCTATHPPGNEIYRHDGVSFFEVDGAVQKKYCQDLCLISKLFIASKTLFAEVETFIFYVLCEITTEGFVIVGYFSKEKNPSKNNNLSCLLVLPMVQKMGYGRLLIDMSYELSRRELKVGHPEHPLSDLGILAYRGYWRGVLLCYLRKHRNSDRLSIKDMCLATRITPVDIVNQLMLDNIINFKGGVYSIKISKRALKFPLSQFRQRLVDPSKLVWKPQNIEHLDPTKINTYV